MHVPLPILLRGGFGPLRFGASVAQLLNIFGPPTDTNAPHGWTPESLTTDWPGDDRIRFDYDAIDTRFYLAKTPDRGPCVIGAYTHYPHATLLGIPAFQHTLRTLIPALEQVGVTHDGPAWWNNNGSMWYFTHGLWMWVYEPHDVVWIKWTTDDHQDGHIDWSQVGPPGRRNRS